MQSVGKYTWRNVSPDSYRTCPSFNLDELQVREDAFPLGGRQGGEQVICGRILAYRHGLQSASA